MTSAGHCAVFASFSLFFPDRCFGFGFGLAELGDDAAIEAASLAEIALPLSRACVSSFAIRVCSDRDIISSCLGGGMSCTGRYVPLDSGRGGAFAGTPISGTSATDEHPPKAKARPTIAGTKRGSFLFGIDLNRCNTLKDRVAFLATRDSTNDLRVRQQRRTADHRRYRANLTKARTCCVAIASDRRRALNLGDMLNNKLSHHLLHRPVLHRHECTDPVQ